MTRTDELVAELKKWMTSIAEGERIDALVLHTRQEGVEWAEKNAGIIVRCKDCKHFGFDYIRGGDDEIKVDCCDAGNYGSLEYPSDTDFCSRGERKETP
jgi:hypothetical protein